MEYNIRPFTNADIPFFNSVRNECTEFLHDNTQYTLPQSYEWFYKNVNPYFIYELNGESVGYFRTSNWMPDCCYVGMDIHKDYRGKGLAVNAYKRFFDYLDYKFNVNIFKLEVLESNIRAFNLYKKLGFVVIDSYIKDGKKSYKMEHNENR